jgi:hypothetical protein
MVMRLPVQAASLIVISAVQLGITATRLNAADTNVDVCEVLQHPESFSGKMISIRTRIRIEFEDFEVDTPSCQKKVMGEIWLEYGKGPKTQPTTWCCGDLTPRDQLDLIQNSTFRIFDRYLRAVRKGKHLYAARPYQAGSISFPQRHALMASTNVPVMVDSDIMACSHPV